MDETVSVMADQFRELAVVVDRLGTDDWFRPTRCEGWDVADVLLHLAQTNEMALGSATGRFDEVLADLLAGAARPTAAGIRAVEDGAGLMVELGRGAEPTEVAGRWERGAEALVEALSSIDPSRRVTWVAGELSVRTLATTRLAETWIHLGDIAEAVGLEVAPTDRLRMVARLAWRTLPYAFGASGHSLAGSVAFRLTGPNGDRWDLVGDEPPVTTITGPAEELCLVAARRAEPGDTSLRGEGPDAAAVLDLVRTFA